VGNNSGVSAASDWLKRALAQMPKAEIHVHLEGASTPTTYFEIARRNGTELKVKSLAEWQQFSRFTNFDHFKSVFFESTQVLRAAPDYEYLIKEFAGQQAALNVLYTEAFVACSLLPPKLDVAEFLDALDRGVAFAAQEHGIVLRFIAGISRSHPETQERVLEIAGEGFKRGLIIGIGLGGTEQGFPANIFAASCRAARESGLHVVVHAGEISGAESVRIALDELGASRIGHGIRSLENPSVVERLRKARIPLEICPRSNYSLGIVSPNLEHPIRALFDLGVWCTVNSDDPAMFGSNLTDEYFLLAQQSFSWDDLWDLNLATLRATFMSNADRLRLMRTWEAFATGLTRST
jgi:adenosine deaminase